MRGGTIQINWHDTKPVLTLDFHPPSGTLATGGSDNDIKLWIISPAASELQNNFPLSSYHKSLSYHNSTVNALRFSTSGDLLASGADGGELLIWKLHSSEDSSSWKVLKTLLFHRKDVLDLQWSPDCAYLLSGSVDNSCIIWDVNKGSVHQILDSHLHYVQGVAWDPLNCYIASLSSDRTCRIYANKPQAANNKHKSCEKLHFVCQYVLSKLGSQITDDSKSPPLANSHFFHDETLSSFFRRLSWSPDGSFLLVPAGVCKFSPASDPINAAFIFSRKDLSRPAVYLPGASKPVVAVRFCPVLFCLRGSNPASSFSLPYRVVFAVATINSMYIYDSESASPIVVVAGLHYAAITDVSWSPDAKYVALSSQDGYCSILEFDKDELGVPYSIGDSDSYILRNAGSSSPDMKAVAEDDMVIDCMEKLEPSSVSKPTKRRITPWRACLMSAAQ